ncbi:MAG: hypothetical protein JWO36_7570 [Myxococcales bacterium]|nr:hypothetical protein [Myxococcales bacterium]
MQTVVAFVSRTPEACWRVFTDPHLLSAWVPALRRARVITIGVDGLPTEIQFEFSESLTYSLTYTYDVAAREVRWEPRAGKRDAVRGFARFDAFDHGTRVTYGLEQGQGRTPMDKVIGDLQALVGAFVRCMHRDR